MFYLAFAVILALAFFGVFVYKHSSDLRVPSSTELATYFLLARPALTKASILNS